MKKYKVETLTRIGMIAAVYTVISLLLAPFSFGNIQVRIAEAFTLLPLIYKPSIIGVTLGCFLTNLIGALMGVNPTGLLDAFVGTLATFLAAYFTYVLRDKKIKGIPFASLAMPIIFNFFFIGAELAYLFMPENVLLGTLIFGTEVAIGEAIAVSVGYFFLPMLKKTKIFTE